MNSRDILEVKEKSFLDVSNINLKDFHFYVSDVLKERNEANVDGFQEEFEVSHCAMCLEY
jgi:hypothetical protein